MFHCTKGQVRKWNECQEAKASKGKSKQGAVNLGTPAACSPGHPPFPALTWGLGQDPAPSSMARLRLPDGARSPFVALQTLWRRMQGTETFCPRVVESDTCGAWCRQVAQDE